MNIYNITKHHPAWAWYQDSLDLNFTSRGEKSTSEGRKRVAKETVDEWMRENMQTPEELAEKIKHRKANNIVHPLYGTD